MGLDLLLRNLYPLLLGIRYRHPLPFDMLPNTRTIRDGLDLLGRRVLLARRHGIHIAEQLVHTLERDALRLGEDEHHRNERHDVEAEEEPVGFGAYFGVEAGPGLGEGEEADGLAEEGESKCLVADLLGEDFRCTAIILRLVN